MAEVRLEKICKHFGEVVAVHNFDLKIKDREFMVLVGPSGCGKSTTLRMVAGLEEITSGDLYIGERRVNQVAPKDRDIAMVFQSYALYPHMTVFENMAFGLRLRRMPRPEIEKRVQEAARILGLEEYLSRKPKELSGGQRQRVAMGRAIVRRPAVFLFDEPLSNLDAKLRVQMRTEIARLHQRLESTSVYVTHDQVEAMTLADRIVVMKDGVVQQVGTPLELYRSPLNQFVATFIGSPAMNILEASLHRQKDQLFVEGEGFSVSLNASVSHTLSRQKDKGDVLVGVRPQHISLQEHKGANKAGRLDVIEPLGAESFLYLDLNGTPLTVREEASIEREVGSLYQISFEAESLHIFDKETGLNLLSESGEP